MAVVVEVIGAEFLAGFLGRERFPSAEVLGVLENGGAIVLVARRFFLSPLQLAALKDQLLVHICIPA
jgi:hypothetical protein